MLYVNDDLIRMYILYPSIANERKCLRHFDDMLERERKCISCILSEGPKDLKSDHIAQPTHTVVYTTSSTFISRAQRRNVISMYDWHNKVTQCPRAEPEYILSNTIITRVRVAYMRCAPFHRPVDYSH